MKPDFLGGKVFDDFPLDELAECIDWTPFFHTWELCGSYPEILNDALVGEQAGKLVRRCQGHAKSPRRTLWLRPRP